MLLSPLVHTAGLPGKAAAMGCWHPESRAGLQSHEMRLKAFLPDGNTQPEWGRRSPVCVHGSKCPGLRAAGICYATVLCRHLLCHSTCTQQLCLSWLWLPCQAVASVPAYPAAHCSQSVPQAVDEPLHSQPVPQCCIWAPSRNLKPLSLGENNKYFNQICQKHHRKGAKPTTVHWSSGSKLVIDSWP